jgi:folate receptor
MLVVHIKPSCHRRHSTRHGAEFHWDRCGPLSQECERFFVQEACFYECDPNAGFFRKWKSTVYDARCDEYAAGYDANYAQATQCAHNTWQMHQMPIKASYWDAMYDACRKDLFCGNGDYFSCAAVYKALDSQQQQGIVSDDGIGAGFIILIVCLAIALMSFCIFTYILVKKERSGKPLFGRLREFNANQKGCNGEVVGAGQNAVGSL